MTANPQDRVRRIGPGAVDHWRVVRLGSATYVLEPPHGGAGNPSGCPSGEPVRPPFPEGL